MDETGEMPLTLVTEMAALGLLGSTLPKSLGGSDMDNLSLALIYEELGRACSSVRGFMTVHSSLVMQCINAWGTDEQKSRYLPAMASGKVIGCYALTEPEAGSDAASIQTVAKKSASGNSYELTGEKIWITNGNIARIAIVFAKLDSLQEKKPHEQVTAFIVRLNNPDIERMRMPGEELGHRASDHAKIVFRETYVSEDLILGGEGNGFKVAMSALDHGRLGVAAGALVIHPSRADVPTSIDFTDPIAVRHAYVGEEFLTGLGLAVEAFDSTYLYRRLLQRQDEDRESLVLGHIPVGTRQDQGPVGPPGA